MERLFRDPPEDEHKLALTILRECLDGGAAEYVTYSGTDTANDFEEPGDDVIAQARPAVSRRSVGRNDACPCGSGKKYKRCCLRK